MQNIVMRLKWKGATEGYSVAEEPPISLSSCPLLVLSFGSLWTHILLSLLCPVSLPSNYFLLFVKICFYIYRNIYVWVVYLADIFIRMVMARGDLIGSEDMHLILFFAMNAAVLVWILQKTKLFRNSYTTL